MDLFQENVVVTANNFNVTLVTQLWLAHNHIILENEFIDPVIITPGLVQVASREFELLVIPNQAQFTPTCDEQRKSQLIADRFGRFVTLLPHTPYSAMGVNFIWHYKPPDGITVGAIGRRLFFKDSHPFSHAFEANDAKFGAYFSKNVLGFRLKLSILPVDIKHGDDLLAEIFQLSFNYHFDSQDATAINGALGRWLDVKQDATELVNQIEVAL